MNFGEKLVQYVSHLQNLMLESPVFCEISSHHHIPVISMCTTLEPGSWRDRSSRWQSSAVRASWAHPPSLVPPPVSSPRQPPQSRRTAREPGPRQCSSPRPGGWRCWNTDGSPDRDKYKHKVTPITYQLQTDGLEQNKYNSCGLFQYTIRRLIGKSCNVSKQRDFCLVLLWNLAGTSATLLLIGQSKSKAIR